MKNYIFEISFAGGQKKMQSIVASTLEEAEEILERKWSVLLADATYELYDVSELEAEK